MLTPDTAVSLLVSVVCTACSMLNWLVAAALTAACAGTKAGAWAASFAVVTYGVLSVPSGPSPTAAGAGCATPGCASVPKAKASTRLISTENPAGPPGGLGVKVDALTGEPRTGLVPSRASDGAAVTAGLTPITEANPT